MNRLTKNPIERIREFAMSPPGIAAATHRQGVPSATAFFDSSRKGTGNRLRTRVTATVFNAEVDELEMCRLARPFGFVVRIDEDLRSQKKPSVKLFRFADRSKPEETFGRFAEAMQWLAQQPVRYPSAPLADDLQGTRRRPRQSETS